jgi:hypothetical protein
LYILLKGLSVPAALTLFRTLRRSLNLVWAGRQGASVEAASARGERQEQKNKYSNRRKFRDRQVPEM